jgi:type IV secretory pathway TrbD component
VLPLVLLPGAATYLRLLEADIEDAWLVVGMNRLRNAYVEMVPGLERYLVTGYYDDEASVLQTYSFRRRVGATHLFAGSPVIVGIVNAVLGGVLAVIIGQALGLATWLQITAGVVVAVLTALALIAIFVRRLRKFRNDLVPRFPRPRTETADPVATD